MKRYFQIQAKNAAGDLAWPQPKGVTAAPDTTTTPATPAQTVAINKALAAAGAGSTLAYFQDLGPVDIE